MIGVGTTIFLVRPEVFPSGTSYLLDTYTAAAAYSLRQLKTGVTNVVRVRRSSDNAESDFTATEITDGTLTTWTGANNGFVVTWYDQVGSNNVTQATAGNQPQIVSSGSVLTKGSLPSIRYDGSTDYLTYGSAIATSDLSTFSVSSATSTGSLGAVLSLSPTTVQSYRIFHDADASTPNYNLIVTNTVPTGFRADLSVQRNDTNQRLLSTFQDSSKNISAFDNGATGGTNTWTGTSTSDGLLLGVQYNAGLTNYLAGDIQEVIIFNTDESANRTSIETDINTYYSIY